MSNLYKGPSIDASYQVSVHLAEGFQRRLLEAQQWAEPVSLTLHSALKKLNTEHSIAYRCFPQVSTLTFFLTCPFGQLTKTSCKSKSFGLVLYSAIKKTSGRGWGWPHTSILGHFICLFTRIINIYGLGEGISTIKKFTSGRGWGMTPGAWAIRYLICLVTLIINIYGLGMGISTIKKFTSGRGWGMTP